MSFQIKDFVSIVAAQINHARGVTTKITDFQAGSVARTLMEAPAVEVEELYLQMFLGLRDAIPVATFLSFGFEKLVPARAFGKISISITPAPLQDIPVPIGTEFSSEDGRTYQSIYFETWPAGQSVFNIHVKSNAIGAIGNASEGIITKSDAFSSDYTINNAAITTGRDAESDTEREARFSEFVGALSRGTVFACLYGARQANVLDTDGNIYEYVTRQGLIESAGYVAIYLYSSHGIPSQELISNAQKIIDGSRDEENNTFTAGYRAAGIKFEVIAMVEREIPLSIQVEMLIGYDLNASVQQEIGDIFSTAVVSVLPGTVLYLGNLIDQLLEAAGVKRIVPLSNSNIVCDVNEVLTAGAINITAL